MAAKRPSSDSAYLARLGLAVVGLRESAGLTQEALGHLAGLHPTYISGIERGVRNPTVVSLLALTRAMEATPAQLLRRAERR